MPHRCLQNIIGLLLVFVSLWIPLRPTSVQAKTTESVQTIDLNISMNDITRVEFGIHISSFESQNTEFKLEVQGGRLTDGKIKARLSILSPLLAGLRGMVPGTRSLTWQSWSDDYPHAWVYLFLKDGRAIDIYSDSQYDGMFPWNISAWRSENSTRPDAAYIQLHSSILEGVDALWKGIGEKGFPRKHYDPEFWRSMQKMSVDPTPETVQFTPDTAGSERAPVEGLKAGALDAFLPLLRTNSELKELLASGYTLYDAALALDVKPEGLIPLQYSGMLALATPEGQDVVVGLITIPLETGQPLTTTINAADAKRRVEQRKASPFLSQAAQTLSPLTFLLDTREGIQQPELNCVQDPSVILDGPVLQAVRNIESSQFITFFPLPNQRWTVDFQLQRGDPAWTDELAQTVLNAWFPSAFADLPIQDIKGIGTGASMDKGWEIAFQPNVTQRDPGLLNRLKSQLPEQAEVHTQNLEKDGDFSFLSLNGRAVMSETGAAPVVIDCGKNIPHWYGDPYPIEEVTSPDEQAPRKNMVGGIIKNGEWARLSGSLPSGERSAQWTSIAFSQPSFLHVLWTVENDGVYYADGWIDGTGWTEPQRLGDDAYWVALRAWPDGEVHLFWDAGLNSSGTVHVWRPAGGTWQKAEHWPGIGYFSEILRDPAGMLHLGYTASDGLDGEFFHRTWASGKGLSSPENISRHLGDIGNTVLRFDSHGHLHAAWSQILEQKTVPDPLTGETSDISGVFYAHWLSDGHWSKPEQVGIQAPYAHTLSMELDNQDEPLILWQTEDGLVSRTKKEDIWQPVVDLAKITPPETPAEFGPDRWVKPSTEIQTGVDTQGQIIAGWLIPQVGLKLAFWSGTAWSAEVDMIPPDESSQLHAEPQNLQMSVDTQDRVHFVFFRGSGLYYGVYDHKKIETHSLGMIYSGYGLPEASLAVDTSGSLVILGLPRSPEFAVKLPVNGIPPTPTIARTATSTMTPRSTSQPSPTAVAQSGNADPLLYLTAVGALLGLLGFGIVARRGSQKKH
jgi:hypothetical protein